MSRSLKTTISVAIITYNSEKFIAQAIDSVLVQDYPNIEIIISDDASTDSTQKILAQYAKKYPDKIKLLLARKNLGATDNWFKCASACCGKYIANLAGDDEFLPGKISKQVEIMEGNANIAICYSDAFVFDVKRGKEIYRLAMKAPTLSGGVYTALSDAIYYSPTIMFRRDLLPKKNIFHGIRHATDLAFYKEIMINSAPNGQIYYLPECFYLYKKHDSNITVTSTSHYREHIESIRILQAVYPQYKKALNPSIYDFCCVAFFKNAVNFKYKKSANFLYEGLCAAGGNPFKFFRSLIWAVKFYLKVVL